MLESPEMAEEVIQDSMVRAWRHIERFDATAEGTSLSAWLYTITNNLARNKGRDAARHKVSLPYGEIPMSVMSKLESLDDDPEKRSVFKTKMGVFSSLPEPAREALAWDPDKTYEEIAEENGLTVSAVKAKLVRAREASRRALSELDLSEAEKADIKAEKARQKQGRRKATIEARKQEREEADDGESAVAA